MNIKIPIEQLREVGEHSLIGALSVANPQVNYIQGNVGYILEST